jgi:adenylate kinase
MVRQALTAAKATGGEYVLDGVPRTMEQAWAGHKIALELGMTADVALHLRADDDELIRRLLARAVVQHRSDDTEVVIRQRLELYHRLTQPIVSWYAKRGILVSVDGMRPARDVGREILATLEVMRPLVEYVPEGLRRPVDLSGLGAAFGEVTTLTTTPGLRARRRLGPYRPGEPDRSSRRDGGWRAGTQGQQSPRLRPYGGSEAHHDERRLG